MLSYALIGLCLVLVGVAGLQFSYLFYADRLQRERRKHLERLERRCADLTTKLDVADQVIAEQAAQLASYGFKPDDEAWADVLEER